MKGLDVLKVLQEKVKAPKNAYNSFGKYQYRTAEGILEVARPLANEMGAALLLSDELVQKGERFYVMARASLLSGAGPAIEATAYARAAEVKKGMDVSQVTGSASSYARKYALAGLLALSGEKDADEGSENVTELLLELARVTKEKGISPDAVKARMRNLFGKHQAKDLAIDEVKILLHEMKGV